MNRFPVLAALLVVVSSHAAETFSFHHENVFGTSAEFHIAATERSHAMAAEKAILAELDRVAEIVSTYDPKSEMNRWLRGDIGEPVSPELRKLLEFSEQFERLTSGAFDPRVAAAVRVWKDHAKRGVSPDSDRLRQIAQQIRSDNAPQNFDAIAKGFIIDRAIAIALRQTGVAGVLINIGGDLRAAGQIEHPILIANPNEPTHAITEFRIRNRAVATSGGYHRYFKIGDRRFSHLIDPRTAKPVDHVKSVTVLADTAAAADALATALSVLSVEESLKLCNEDPRYACLIIDRDGLQHASRDWPRDATLVATLTESADDSPSDDFWPTGAKLQVNFELSRISDARYRRPYFAIWIEDKDKFPIRTLVLWLQTTGKGPRWHRDLKRWFKQESLRNLVDGGRLIGTVSSATRPAGRYRTVWDGKDNNGKFVKQGEYTLYVEAAREHGTYQLMRANLTIGDRPQTIALKGNVEVKSAIAAYKPE